MMRYTEPISTSPMSSSSVLMRNTGILKHVASMRRMRGASSLVMTAAATSVKSVASGETVLRFVAKYRAAAGVVAILRAMSLSFLLPGQRETDGTVLFPIIKKKRPEGKEKMRAAAGGPERKLTGISLFHII